MTVNVAFDGTVIDTADVAANWTAIKITSGGQGPSAVAADAAYEGTNNVTCRSDAKRVYMYTDIGAGNELNFTPAGNAEGDLFYIWVNFLPSPLLALQSLGGLGIFMSTNAPSASNYALWYFEGRDTYTGGWIRLCVDPNKTPSLDNDSFNPASVRYFGAFAHNDQGTAKYDNFVVDQCAYGKGLIVTGTSTLGLAEELVADETANRHGIVQPLNSSGTAVEILGKITLGDSVGTVVTNINDSNSKFFAASPKYYETTLQASAPLDFAGLDIVGNATGNTDVIFGTPVGTTAGRNGIALVGNDTYNFGVDRDDAAVESADFYGGSFESLTGVLSLDGAHDFNSQTLSDCGPVTINSPTIGLTHVASGAITLTGTGSLTKALIINNTGLAAVFTDDLVNVDDSSLTRGASGYGVDLSGLAAATTAAALGTDTNYDTFDAFASHTTFSHTLVAGSNRVVIVMVAVSDALEGAANTIAESITYGGVAMTKLTDAFLVNNDIGGAIWYILEADLPANGSQTVAYTSAMADGGMFGICATQHGDMLQTPPTGAAIDTGLYEGTGSAFSAPIAVTNTTNRHIIFGCSMVISPAGNLDSSLGISIVETQIFGDATAVFHAYRSVGTVAVGTSIDASIVWDDDAGDGIIALACVWESYRVSSSMAWDNKLSGYAAGVAGSPVVPTAVGDEAINVSDTTGTVTINVADGADIPSVRSAGATVNIVAGLKTFSFTVNPSITGYEWRMYEITAVGALDGQVEVAGEEIATADNQSYVHGYTNQPFALQIISANYEEVILYYTLGATDLPVIIPLDLDTNK